MKTHPQILSLRELLPVALVATAIFAIPRAQATNYTWAGGTANWDAAASWTPNIAGGPVTGDSIINPAAGLSRMNVNSTTTPSISLVDLNFSQMGGTAAIYNNASTGGNSSLSFVSTGTLTKATAFNLTIRGHSGGNMSLSLNNIEMTDGQLYLGADYNTDARYGLTSLNVSGTANLSSTTAGSAFAVGTAPGVAANFQQVNLGGNLVFRLSATGGADRVRNVTMTGLNGTSGTTVQGNTVNNTGTSHTTLTINSTPSTTSTFNGTISNGTGTGHFLNLVKGNTGTQVLGGNNTYTGTTTVNAGTLIINNTAGSGTGTGAVTVNVSGTLGGNGTISGATTVNGTIAAGNSIGTLNTGNLSISSTGVLDNELGRSGVTPVSDRVNVTGTVSLASGADLKLTLFSGLNNPAENDIFFLISNDSTDAVSGVFTKLNGSATTLNEGSVFSWNSQSWKITYLADFGTSSFTGGNDIALQVVPEPTTWAFIAFSLTSVLVFRRRRFQC